MLPARAVDALRKMRHAQHAAETAWNKALTRQSQIRARIEYLYRPGSGRELMGDLEVVQLGALVDDKLYKNHLGDHIFFINRATMYAQIALAEMFAENEG